MTLIPALVALVALGGVLLIALGIALSQFPRGLFVLAAVAVAVGAAWYGLLRTERH